MRLLPALLFALSLLAEVSGMSGQWVLNEKRSRFGDNPRPGNVFLNIEHNEPKFKYTGTINRAGEGAITHFSFDGAIDGKQYETKQPNGNRKITFSRVDDRTIESTGSFEEGEEKSRITISKDGRTLERRMTFHGKDGKTRSWVEIYEKK